MRTDAQESIETGQPVEWMAEDNFKFRLSAFQKPLLKWLETHDDAILPRTVQEQVMQEVRSGLTDLSVSRPRSRLHWGVPVPAHDEHTVYVWVDALANYLTALGYPTGDAHAWPADVHVVGKDIVRFHAVYWPALLLAAGLPLPRQIVAHAHWTVQKAKMSKSRGNSVDPFAAIARHGVDTVRCYLMRVGGNIGADADYSAAMLVEFQRKFLRGQLGNLLSRILAPKIQARLLPHAGGGVITRPDVAPPDEALVALLHELPRTFDAYMQRRELARALATVFDVIAAANERLQMTAPWAAGASDTSVLQSVYLTAETLRVCGVLLQPFMPRAMSRLLDALEITPDERRWHAVAGADGAARLRDTVPLRASKTKIAPLFPQTVDVAPLP